jgi:hypothetical protein
VNHPRILGIGTATPPDRLTQEQTFHAAGYQSERIRKIFLNSDINYRHFYLEGALNRQDSSEKLSQRYLRGAMKTGCRAILNCLKAAETTVQDVDFLAVCTCTGYVCPDVGSRLIAHMGFSNNLQRASIVGLPDVPPSTSPQFDFRRLGVRVPAVFVSPRIPPNVIINDRDYDHCSIVATVRKLFCGPNANSPFNWREAQAPTFENMLTLANPRPDVQLPAPIASAPLTAAQIQAATQAMAANNTITLEAAAQDESQTIIRANALPKQPPADAKPSDLMVAMVRAMDYSLQQRGIAPPSDIKNIYTAQDAADYMAAANKAAGGGA